MRVKVEYSIDLEEIPDEIKTKVISQKKVLDELQIRYNNILKQMDEPNFLEACNEMKLFSNSSVKLHESINDCYNILMGYVNYKTKGFIGSDSKKETVDEPTE